MRGISYRCIGPLANANAGRPLRLSQLHPAATGSAGAHHEALVAVGLRVGAPDVDLALALIYHLLRLLQVAVTRAERRRWLPCSRSGSTPAARTRRTRRIMGYMSNNVAATAFQGAGDPQILKIRAGGRHGPEAALP